MHHFWCADAQGSVQEYRFEVEARAVAQPTVTSTDEAFHRQARQWQEQEQEHTGQDTLSQRQWLSQAHMPRVPACKEQRKHVYNTCVLPPLFGQDNALHTDATSFQNPTHAAKIVSFREALQYVSPFNTDDAVSFMHDWEAQRPVGRPSECSSRPLSTYSSSMHEHFEESCVRHHHMRPATSSEELAAQYNSHTDASVISNRDARSFSDFRSVVDDLEELDYARGSVHGSETPQSDLDSRLDCSQTPESGSYSHPDRPTVGGQQQSVTEDTATTELTAQSDSVSQGHEQRSRTQSETVHLAESLGVSAAYVQQMQHMQRHMEHFMQQSQLEISGLRCALAEAHCKIAAQGSELKSLRSLQHLALQFPFQPFVHPPVAALPTQPSGDHTASSGPVESINSCIGAPANVNRAPEEREDAVCQTVWNPVFSIESQGQSPSGSSSSAHLPISVAYTSSHSSNANTDSLANDPLLPDEQASSSHSSGASCSDECSSSCSSQPRAAATALRATSAATKRLSGADVSCDGVFPPLSGWLSSASTSVNRAKRALKAAEDTAAQHQVHIVELLQECAADSSDLQALCSDSSRSVSPAGTTDEECSLQALDHDNDETKFIVEHNPRLLAAMQLLREAARDAQKLFTAHEPAKQPRAPPPDAAKGPQCDYSASVSLVHHHTGSSIAQERSNQSDLQSQTAVYAWSAVQQSAWLAGSIVGLVSLASSAFEAAACRVAVHDSKPEAILGEVSDEESNDNLDDDQDCMLAARGDMGMSELPQLLEMPDEPQDSLFNTADNDVNAPAGSIPILPFPCAAFMMGAEDAAGLRDEEPDHRDTLTADDPYIELPVSVAARSSSITVVATTPETTVTAVHPVPDARTVRLDVSNCIACKPETAVTAAHAVPHAQTVHLDDTGAPLLLSSSATAAPESSGLQHTATEQMQEGDSSAVALSGLDAATAAGHMMSAFATAALQIDGLENCRLQPDLLMALYHHGTEGSQVLDIPVCGASVTTESSVDGACLSEHPPYTTTLSSVESSSIEGDMLSEDTSLLLIGFDVSLHEPLLQCSASIGDVFSADGIVVATASEAPGSTSRHGSAFKSCKNAVSLSMAEVSTNQFKLDSASSPGSPLAADKPQTGPQSSSTYCGSSTEDLIESNTEMLGSCSAAEKLVETSLASTDAADDTVQYTAYHAWVHDAQEEAQLTREPSVADWGVHGLDFTTNFAGTSLVPQSADSAAQVAAVAESLVDSAASSYSGGDVTLWPGVFEEMSDDFDVHDGSTDENTACGLLCLSPGSADYAGPWQLETDQLENDASRAVELSLEGLPTEWLGRRFASDAQEDFILDAAADKSVSHEHAVSDCAWLCSPEGFAVRKTMFASRISTHGGLIWGEGYEQGEVADGETKKRQVFLGYSVSAWFDHPQPDAADLGADWDSDAWFPSTRADGAACSCPQAHTALFDESWFSPAREGGESGQESCNSPPADAASFDAVLNALVAAGMHSPAKDSLELCAPSSASGMELHSTAEDAESTSTFEPASCLSSLQLKAVAVRAPAASALSASASDTDDELGRFTPKAAKLVLGKLRADTPRPGSYVRSCRRHILGSRTIRTVPSTRVSDTVGIRSQIKRHIWCPPQQNMQAAFYEHVSKQLLQPELVVLDRFAPKHRPTHQVPDVSEGLCSHSPTLLPSLTHSKIASPQPLSPRAFPVSGSDECSPRSFAPQQASFSAPSSSSSMTDSLCGLKVPGSNSIAAGPVQSFFCSPEEAVCMNSNKRSAGTAETATEQPFNQLSVQERKIRSRGPSLQSLVHVPACSSSLFGACLSELPAKLCKSNRDHAGDKQSTAHGALMRSLKRHRQDAACSHLSPSPQRRCAPFEQQVDVDVSGQWCSPEHRGGSIAATATASLSTPPRADVSSASHLGHLSSTNIRSNLAAARRALKCMQENDL